MNEQQILENRRILIEFFSNKSKERGINVNPERPSEKDILLFADYYSETRRNRRIQISENEWTVGISAFCKKTGLYYDVELLCIFTDSVTRDADKLWSCYVNWMHENGLCQELVREFRQIM